VSIKLLSAAWDLAIGSTEKMVLMCLCNFANDEGANCWPSVATIARKCSKSDRTVQGALKWLEDNGYLVTKTAPGKSNQFQLDPRKICTPAESAPPQKTSKTPAESAPNPSRTVSSGLADAKPIRAIRRKGWPVIPDWIPTEPWNGFVQMRDRKRAAPTPRAVTLLIAKLERLRASGHDPGDILDTSTEHSWTGLFEPKAPPHGQHSRSASISPPPGSRGTRPSPLIDILAELQQTADPADDPGDDYPAWPAVRAIGSGG
jgi:hypothetical protein